MHLLTQSRYLLSSAANLFFFFWSHKYAETLSFYCLSVKICKQVLVSSVLLSSSPQFIIFSKFITMCNWNCTLILRNKMSLKLQKESQLFVLKPPLLQDPCQIFSLSIWLFIAVNSYDRLDLYNQWIGLYQYYKETKKTRFSCILSWPLTSKENKNITTCCMFPSQQCQNFIACQKVTNRPKLGDLNQWL